MKHRGWACCLGCGLALGLGTVMFTALLVLAWLAAEEPSRRPEPPQAQRPQPPGGQPAVADAALPTTPEEADAADAAVAELERRELPADAAPPPLDEEERRVAALADEVRRQAGLAPATVHAALQPFARRGREALAASLRRRPDRLELPREVQAQAIADAVDEALTVWVQAAVADDFAALAEEVRGWDLLGRPDLTHLGVSAAQVALDGGPRWVAIGIGARMLVPITAASLNAGERHFVVSCPHCGKRWIGTVERPDDENLGSLEARCTRCGRTSDLFAGDTEGRLHRPPWYLRRYRPAEFDDPVRAWLWVLTTFRYSDDLTQFGRQEVWQTPRQTADHRLGDCEDTALLLADWLTAAGYEARVVLGEADGAGHAWVLLRQEDGDYLLETTGGRGNWRRMPPRASLLTGYVPDVQVTRDHLWYRTGKGWTADYDSPAEWTPVAWPTAHREKQG